MPTLSTANELMLAKHAPENGAVMVGRKYYGGNGDQAKIKNPSNQADLRDFKSVESSGLEPLTSALSKRRSEPTELTFYDYPFLRRVGTVNLSNVGRLSTGPVNFLRRNPQQQHQPNHE